MQMRLEHEHRDVQHLCCAQTGQWTAVLIGVLQVSDVLSTDDGVSTSYLNVEPAYGLQPPVPFQQPGPPQPMPHPDTPGDGGGDTTLTHNPVYR